MLENVVISLSILFLVLVVVLTWMVATQVQNHEESRCSTKGAIAISTHTGWHCVREVKD